MQKTLSDNKLPSFIQQRLTLLCKQDFLALAELLDENLKYVHATGVCHNKEEYLKFIQERITILSANIENITLIEDNSSLLLNGILVQTFKRYGENSPTQARSWISEFWLNKDGWKLYSFQSTRIE